MELARTAVGCTSPNPMVGCVIVRDGEIVGEGFHPKAGQPHAEVFAVKNAGILAENATAYVSLEPCNHYGRTPPCTEALIHAKVKQVVVGMTDPNPIVSSKGVEKLRKSGIEVIVGVEEMLCRKLNEAYIHRMIMGKPFVTLRYSLSFNGRVLNKLGQGAEEEDGYYSKLLQEYDGVLTPTNFPQPTSRQSGANQPFQLIIARGATHSIHLPSPTVESPAKILVLSENAISMKPEREGVEVVVLEQLNLSSVLEYFASRGLCSILIDFRGDAEGLSGVIEDGLEKNLVQKVLMEVLPTWDVGEETTNFAFGSKSLCLKDLRSITLNESILVEGYIS